MEGSRNKGDRTSNIFIRLLVNTYFAIEVVIFVIISLVSQIICCFLFFPVLICSRKARLIIFGYCLRFCMYLSKYKKKNDKNEKKKKSMQIYLKREKRIEHTRKLLIQKKIRYVTCAKNIIYTYIRT